MKSNEYQVDLGRRQVFEVLLDWWWIYQSANWLLYSAALDSVQPESESRTAREKGQEKEAERKRQTDTEMGETRGPAPSSVSSDWRCREDSS